MQNRRTGGILFKTFSFSDFLPSLIVELFPSVFVVEFDFEVVDVRKVAQILLLLSILLVIIMVVTIMVVTIIE